MTLFAATGYAYTALTTYLSAADGTEGSLGNWTLTPTIVNRAGGEAGKAVYLLAIALIGIAAVMAEILATTSVLVLEVIRPYIRVPLSFHIRKRRI